MDHEENLRFIADSWILDLKNMVLSGGAQKGNAFIGALKVLNEIFLHYNNKSIFDQMEGFGGSSIGALISMAFAMGLDVTEVESWMLEHDTSNIFNDINLKHAYEKGGLLKSSVLKGRIVELISKKFPENITLSELYQKTKKILKIVVVNLSRNTTEVFDAHSEPDIAVIDAVTMSMTVPFLFEPFFYKNQWYADGGLYRNFPITLFPPENVIGLRVKGTVSLPVDFTIASYASCIGVNTMFYYENEILKHLTQEYQERTITISLPPCSFTEMIDAPRSLKTLYMKKGEETAKEFIYRVVFMNQINYMKISSLLSLMNSRAPPERSTTETKNDQQYGHQS